MLNQKSFNDLVMQILTSICNQFEEYFMILGDPEIVLVEHNNWDPNIPMQVSEDGNQIDINLQGFYGLLEKEAKSFIKVINSWKPELENCRKGTNCSIKKEFRNSENWEVKM